MMGGFALFKQKTSAIRQRFSKQTKRQNSSFTINDEITRHDDGQPLLHAELQGKKKHVSPSEKKTEISDFAIASAMIVNSLSDDTKSTMSSDLYHPQRSPKEQRFEHPNVNKRDIFVSDNAVQKNAKPESAGSNKPTKYHLADPKAPALASYSISGSMLYSNMENGYLREGSKAVQKLTSPPVRPSGLPPNAVIASTLFRSITSHEKDVEIKAIKARKTLHESHAIESKLRMRNTTLKETYSSRNEDSNAVEDGPYVTIERSDSNGGHSTVSSVTMYSSYQHDPLVPASRNLLDILRSNRFDNFVEETESACLYEA